MASETDTAVSLIVPARGRKEIDRRNKPCNINTKIQEKEHTGYEHELQTEGTKGDEQIEPNPKLAERNPEYTDSECFLYAPSVEEVAYEANVRQSEDRSEGKSDDTTPISEIAKAEEAEEKPVESPGLDAKDKENSTCDPEKLLERTLPSNPPMSPEKLQETVSEVDDLESTSIAVVQGPEVMAQTEKNKSMKDGYEKTTSSEVEDPNKSQTSSSPMSDIMKNVVEIETSLGASNITVEEKNDLHVAELDCNKKEASKSLSQKYFYDMTRSCETLKSKIELEDKNIENNTESQGEEMNKWKGKNSIEDTFTSNIESGITMKGALQTATMKHEECIVKEMMMQERKEQEIQDKALTLTSENTEAVESMKENSFSMQGKTKSWIANSKDQNHDIDTLGVRNCDSADIDQDITTEANPRGIADFRENSISKKEDDLCLGYNAVAKVERDEKHDLDFELQPEELEKQAIGDSSHEIFYNEQAFEASKEREFTSSDRTAEEEKERKGVGHATYTTTEEGVPEVLESESEERQQMKIKEELTEELTKAETKHMAFDSNLQESSVASTNKIFSLIERTGKDSAKGEQLSDKFIDNGTAEESSNRNQATDTTATSTLANLSVKSMNSNEREEATMEVDIYKQEHQDTINKEDIASAEKGDELNDAIEKLDSCTKADFAGENYGTSEETKNSESGESSIDTKEEYAISTETLLQKAYDEDQVQCNAKTERIEAKDSKRKLEEAHEVAKQHYFDEPQSITKETVQEDILNAIMEKKADAKEFEIKSSYPPQHDDDSSMQVFEVKALERYETNEIQEVEELEYMRFEENNSKKAEVNHESIQNSKNPNAPIDFYNDGTQVAEAEDKADSQHGNTEDEKIYNAIINVSSKQDTHKKSSSIEEQSEDKTQAQISFIENQDTGVNHEDIVRKSAKQSATCIEKQEQKISEESTSTIEVENHVPSKERMKFFNRDVQDNETEESAMEKQQCRVEGNRTSNITYGVRSYEIRGVDSVEGKWKFENIVEDTDQDLNAKSDSIEVLQDEKAHEEICFNEISETKVFDNETVMNQISEENNSYCERQEKESADACRSSPPKEVKQPTLSTDERIKKSSEDIEESEAKEEAIDKQIKDPDMVIRGFHAHKGREDEIQPKNANSMNILKEGKIEKIDAMFNSIETQKEAGTNKQACSKEIKETKVINNEIVNQSSEESDSCSGGNLDQESAQVSTPLTVDDNPVPSKGIHTESTSTNSQGNGIDIEASTEEQHCGAEDPDVITNGVSSNKDMKTVLQTTELQKDEKTIEQTGSNVIYETKPTNNEEFLTQRSKAVHTPSRYQEENILETSIPLTQVKSTDPSKDECTMISGEELHEVTVDKQQCKSETETMNITTAPENENSKNILENVSVENVASSYSIREVEIVPASESSIDTVEDKDQELNDEENKNQCSKDSDYPSRKQDEEIVDEAISLIGAQHLVPSNDECTRVSSDIIQVKEVEDTSQIGNQQCHSETKDSNEIENSDSSYKVDREKVVPENEISMNRVTDVSQDTDVDLHKLEEQTDDNTQGHIGLNEIHKTEVVNDKNIEDRTPHTNEFLGRKQDQENFDVSRPIIEAENHGPSIDRYTTGSNEQFNVSIKEEPAINCIETMDPHKTRNGVCLDQGRRREIVPGNENSIDIMEDIDQGIHPESNIIEAQMHENTHEQTINDEIQEIHGVNNEETSNRYTKESDSCNGEHDEEIAEAPTTLGEAENPVPTKDEFTRISDDKIQPSEVKDAAPINKQQCYSETKEPKMIDNDVSSCKVEKVAHVPDTICQIAKEFNIHGYTHSNEKQGIEDDKVQLDSIEMRKDDETYDNGIYKTEDVKPEKVVNQSSRESNIHKQDQEIAQASIPIIEAKNLIPSIDKCTSTCEDIQISEVKDEAMTGKEQCSTEMEDLNKNTNGVSSYEETVPQEDMEEAPNTSTTVEIQQAKWQMRPPHVEEHENLSAQDNEVIIDGSESKQDSREVSSEEINAKLSTEKLELDDAEKEVTFPSSMNVRKNCQEVNNTEVSYNFPECETKEPNQTAACKKLEEIHRITKPVTELEVKADEKSSEKPLQDICLREVEQKEHNVPSLKDEPIKYSMPKQELAEKSKRTGESTAEPEDSLSEFDVNSSISLNSSLEFEDEAIKDTTPKQELTEKGLTTGDSTADSKTPTERMSYSDCSPQTIVTRNKGKDSNILLGIPIVSPPIDSGCGSSSKAYTKYHDQTESSQQVTETYGEELTEINEAHQKMHHQIKSIQPIAEERSLPDFGIHKATRNEDTHYKNTVTEETNASDDSKIFEGEATMETHQEALSEKTTEYQVHSVDTVDIASEQTSDINSNMQDNLKDVKHEPLSEPTEFKEIDGSNSQDTFLQADMAEALDVTTTVEIQQVNTFHMFPPHIEEFENLTAQDTKVIIYGSELNQDSRDLSSKEIIENQSTEKLELDDAKRAVTYPNSMAVHMDCQEVNATVVSYNFPEKEMKEPLQTRSCKNIEVIQGTRKPVIKLKVKADENLSEKQEQETRLPEEEEKESKIPSLKDVPIDSMPKHELAEKGSRTGDSTADPEDSSLEFKVNSSMTLNLSIDFKDEPIKDSRPEQELAESGQTTGCGPSSKCSSKYHEKTESSQSEPHGEELTETNETHEKMHHQLKSIQLIAEERSSSEFGGHEATKTVDNHDKNTVFPCDPTLAQQNMWKIESLDNEEKAVVGEEQGTNTELINPSVNGGAAVSAIGLGLNGNLDFEEVSHIKDRKEDDNPHIEIIVTKKGNHNNLSASSELQDPSNNVDGRVDISEKRQLQDDSREEPEEQDITETCTGKGVFVIELGRSVPLKDPVKESLKEPATDNPSSIMKDESREHVHQEGANNEPIKTQAESNTLDSSINLPSNRNQETSAQTNYMFSDITARDKGAYAREDSDLNAPLISDMELKATHKKSHNILSGVGSKVKNSIVKVKKALACTTSQFAQEEVIIKLSKIKNADKE